MRKRRIRQGWVIVAALVIPMVAVASIPSPPLPLLSPFPSDLTQVDESFSFHRAPPLPEDVAPSFLNISDNELFDQTPSQVESHAASPLETETEMESDFDSTPRNTTEEVDEPAPHAPESGESDQRQRAQGAALSGDTLEGPPVPLARELKLNADVDTAIDSHEAQRLSNDSHNRPITLNFKNAELSEVLTAFARFTGLNIIASERVRGSVSLHLTHVRWRTAFEALLNANGLAMAQHGNVIWVAPLAELAARERQRFEAHARSADLEPLASRTFVLHYPRAEDVQRLLTASGGQRVLSKRGSAMAEPRTNLLFVTDLAARLLQIAELIEKIDQPTRQVLIEARIVEGEQGFSREIGTRLSLRPTTDGISSKGLLGGGEGVVHDFAARPYAGFDVATAGFTLFAAQATRLVNIELSALEAEGRGQIVSSPRVVTADRAKALVEQGTELPYQTKIRNGVSGVQFRRASLKLEVEPQITPGGRVVLDLDIAKDSVGEATAAGPAINTKHVRTRVEVEDGGTVSIGGIYESDDRRDVTRVPLLGKIPLIGALFRHRAQRERSSELAIFITPRIVVTD